MKIVLIAGEKQKEEWLAQPVQKDVTAEWIKEPKQVDGAGCYIDLLFQPDKNRISILQQLQPALMIVNSVITPNSDLPADFIRINGWPTFLQRTVAEASCLNEPLKEKAEKIFQAFHRKTEWVADLPGFLSARVISMIINEAYFTLEEKVSTKKEIDTAMKLGTNYPYGPFEWSEKIGLKHIYDLLTELSGTNTRYQPSDLLQKEALSP